MKGSSRKTRAGSWMNAAASMSFCRVPFERSLQSVVPPSSRSKSSNQGAIRSSRPSSFRTRPTKYRYSCAVKYDGGDSTSGTIPTSVFTWSGSRTTSTLSTCASPEVGRSWPVRIRSIVVLPAAFGPNKPKNSPGSTAMSTPFNASTVPKRFVSWDAWIAGTPPTTRAALFRTWLMIIEARGPKLFGVRPIVPGHAHGPLRLRREHVPERAVRGALQRDGAARVARRERRRSSGPEHQPGRAGAPPGDRDRAGSKGAANGGARDHRPGDSGRDVWMSRTMPDRRSREGGRLAHPGRDRQNAGGTARDSRRTPSPCGRPLGSSRSVNRLREVRVSKG